MSLGVPDTKVNSRPVDLIGRTAGVGPQVTAPFRDWRVLQRVAGDLFGVLQQFGELFHPRLVELGTR
jgi:hypothetical protein